MRQYLTTWLLEYQFCVVFAGLDRPTPQWHWICPCQAPWGRQAVLRGHGGATRRPELATRWRRRRHGYSRGSLERRHQTDTEVIGQKGKWVAIAVGSLKK